MEHASGETLGQNGPNSLVSCIDLYPFAEQYASLEKLECTSCPHMISPLCMFILLQLYSNTVGMSMCNHWMHAINMEKTWQITFGCFRTDSWLHGAPTSDCMLSVPCHKPKQIHR